MSAPLCLSTSSGIISKSALSNGVRERRCGLPREG
jgi:hypothetical protein